MHCKSCGYDLRGLNVGQQCPECGVTIAMSAAAGGRYAGLGHAPSPYLTRLTFGLLLLGLSVPIKVMAGWSIASGSGKAALFLALAGVMWFAGVFIVCQPRPREPDEYLGVWEERFRVWAMILGLAGMLGTLAESTVAMARPGSMLETVVAITSVVFQFIGVLGLFPLAAHLANLADWGSDTGLGNRLRGVAWCLCVGGLLVVGNLGLTLALSLTGSAGGGFIGSIGGLCNLGAVIGIVLTYGAQIVLIISIIQLLSMVGWAKRNAVSEVERDRRLAERHRQRAEELVHPTEPIEPPDTSDFLPADRAAEPAHAFDESGPAEPAPGPKPDTRTPEEIMGRDLDPYTLEDED